MDTGRSMEVSAFDMLFTRNVPHILENIYFSLDYRSYLSCFNVNRAWNDLLSSQSYKAMSSKKLKNKEENEKKLWHASREGNFDEVKSLLSSGIWMDMNCVPSDSFYTPSTPLYEATCIGYDKLVQLLLDAGADPNVASASKCKYIPLCLAARNGNKEVVQLLLNSGADPDKADHFGSISLHAAVQSGYRDVAELLLNAGAQPNNENENGWSPLHLASLNGQLEISQLLLERGADPNKASAGKYKQTPIYWAAHYGRGYGHEEVVKLQLEHGWTPLHLAALHGHLEIAQLLLERGADPNKTNIRGSTPLHHAAEKGHVKVVQLLEQYTIPGHNSGMP